ncbi:MAG: hypothetical protein FJY85_11170 [Deltaproteobacteria bacterium]|nr:hypothetical protein [Deltaproteobacteria bacterium]
MVKTNPKQLVESLLLRSSVNVQVAAVIQERTGRIVSWSWNHSGPDGFGMCAERWAIQRANRKRLRGSTLYVGGRWKKSGNWVDARPCPECSLALDKAGVKVVHSTKEGGWRELS